MSQNQNNEDGKVLMTQLPITGVIRLDKRTKNLAKRLRQGEIALIDHEDIDSVSADMLIERNIAAVVNASASISGHYPNIGPKMLIDAGIPILDDVGTKSFELVAEGEHAEIVGNELRIDGETVCKGTILTRELADELLEESKKNLDVVLERFAENTLSYVVKEKSILLDETKLPHIETKLGNKHVLIVVRGEGYKEDLSSLRAYINEMRPVLIAVDGGADALLEMGYKPHIIVGDMDSVTDKALRCGAEIIVHAYADAKRGAPGMARLESLGLSGTIAAIPGTSEDVAMLMAYERGATLIVAVGTHSNLIDFLDKGRKGMSSTFLVRLKVGTRLVDARGVSKLYGSRHGGRYAAVLMLAAVMALVLIIAFSPVMQDKIRLFMMEQQSRIWDLWIRLKLWER